MPAHWTGTLPRARADDAWSGPIQLKSFLIIGIIAAVRPIVGVGARLTLYADETTEAEFHRSRIELGVSAAVVFALARGLFLISRANVE